MRRVSIAVVALVVLALPILYSTLNGYTTWWFRRFATVKIDGNERGYVHGRRNNVAVIITRTDISPHQSYLVALSGRKTLIHCGEWSAPRFPVFPIGDVNPPCSVFSNGASNPRADSGLASTLVVQPHAIEFTTRSGKHLRASW